RNCLLLDGIILKCSASLKTHRTHSAIYNILKGAKAIQTILDVHLYQLKNVYGIYPSLHKKDFDYHIKQLIGSGHLLLLDENKIERTPRGEELQKKCEKTSAYHNFNEFQYTGIREPYIKRLLHNMHTLTNKKIKTHTEEKSYKKIMKKHPLTLILMDFNIQVSANRL